MRSTWLVVALAACSPASTSAGSSSAGSAGSATRGVDPACAAIETAPLPLAVEVPRPLPACEVATNQMTPIAVCEAKCRCGVASACAVTADKYLRGDGVVASAARSLQFAVESCDLGQALGCDTAGLIYTGAYGVAADEVRGALVTARMFDLEDRDCTAGDGGACLELASHYAHDYAVVAPRFAHDDEKAATYRARGAALVRAACARGDGYACELQWRDADDKDPVEAVWLAHVEQLERRACELGYAPSCERAALGGIGEAYDRLRRRGCDLGYGFSCHILAEHGAREGGSDDPDAIALERRACSLGELRSCKP